MAERSYESLIASISRRIKYRDSAEYLKAAGIDKYEISLAPRDSRAKYKVLLYKNLTRGRSKTVYFGAKGYPDYHQLYTEGRITEANERRKRFLARFATLIEKNKKNPHSPMFWSFHGLW